MTFKMKGHTLPGPNQKSAPAKLLGIAALTAAMIAKAAIGGAVGAGIGKGIGAIAKGAGKRKAVKKEAQAKAAEGTTQAGAMGEAGAVATGDKKSSKIV